ncbi:MAG: heavy metal translocating P-type ATPase [Candidatus Hermodarchaeia archaeon]
MHGSNEENACSTCEVDYSQVVDRTSLWSDRRFLIILISTILFSVGLISEFLLGQPFIALVVFFFAASIAGFFIAKAGISGLIFRHQLNIAFLMTIAAVASFLIGHPAEGAAVMVLYFIAEFLESKAKEKAQRSVASLMKLAPEIAIVKRAGTEVSVHVHDVDVDETVIVRPGEKIPLDGVVSSGTSSVNQAPITGESVPVTKHVNDEVFAGTINNEGFLEVQVTRLSVDTVLSKILALVEEAQKDKSPTEHFIDKVAKYYTPTIVLLALIVAILPPLLLSVPWFDWIYRGLVLLVISCPCAFAISTPVAMVSALTSATRNGVLIKGSRYIEELGNVKAVAFDKTGTLTEGQLVVTDIVSVNGSADEVLEVAASLETFSEHPISQAIVEKVANPGVSFQPVKNFNAITGRGVTGTIDGMEFFVGSERLFTERGIPYSREQVDQLEREGKTVVLVGSENELIGIIAVQDVVRQSAIKAISVLKRMGILPVMLTGDNLDTARAIASEVGIEEVYAELLPAEKVKVIKTLQERYGPLAMVGDGVNDAPALAVANVGIAMGAIGSDAAIDTADIALMQDDLSKLPYLFRLSKKTRGIVRENVVASLVVKFTLAVLAFPGLISLWVAVAVGDMGLSLAVILNAMRLARIRTGVNGLES